MSAKSVQRYHQLDQEVKISLSSTHIPETRGGGGKGMMACKEIDHKICILTSMSNMI